MWIAITKDDDESWWFDAYLLGRCRLSGGRQCVEDFARWLLAPVPEGVYETEFVLIDNERQTVGHAGALLGEGQYLNIEILLGRNESGGPESLTVVATGDTGPPSYRAFLLFAGLECEPVDRDYLERAAAELLGAL